MMNRNKVDPNTSQANADCSVTVTMSTVRIRNSTVAANAAIGRLLSCNRVQIPCYLEGVQIQVSLKLNKNNGTLHEDLRTFLIVYDSVLLRMRNVSDKIVEKVETHILRSITVFKKSCHI